MTVRYSQLAGDVWKILQHKAPRISDFVYAQGYLESSGYKSQLSIQCFNFWGIKWTKRSPYPGKNWPTQEYILGQRVNLPQGFIDFPGAAESIDWYLGLLDRRYRGARDAQTIEEFAAGLRGWATDPRYYIKVVSVYKRVRHTI